MYMMLCNERGVLLFYRVVNNVGVGVHVSSVGLHFLSLFYWVFFWLPKMEARSNISMVMSQGCMFSSSAYGILPW